MAGHFESICRNEGSWDGVWTFFRPPTAGQPTPTVANERRSTLIFERLAPNRLRQTNRYHGQGDLVWEYEDTPDGLKWYEVKGAERKPGDPNFIAAVRAFEGEISFTSGYLKLLDTLPFVSEQGIVEGDRKRRGMVMYDAAGAPATLIAIRETRGGALIDEDNAVVTLDDLRGEWTGEGRILSAGGPPESRIAARLVVEQDTDQVRLVSAFGDSVTSVTGSAEGQSVRLSNGHRLVLLPGRIVLGYPEQIPGSGDRSFTVGLWWLPEPNRLRRMVRQYDADGVWQRTILTDERRGG
jgi:hypothetical protein